MVRIFKYEEFEYQKKQYQFSTIKLLVNEESRYGKLGYQGSTINVKHDYKIKSLCRLVKPSLYDIVKLSLFFSFNELIIITTLYELGIGCLNMLR